MSFTRSAFDVIDRGLSVIPVRQGTKIPLLKGWPDGATRSPDQVLRWALDHGESTNVAAVTHGHVVLDADGPQGLRELERLDLPDTYTTSTPRGEHCYFRGDVASGSVRRIASGLDVKANRRGQGTGYVLSPRSEVNGCAYSVRIDAPIADAPRFLIELVSKGHTSQIESHEEPLYAGTRNCGLTAQAGALYRAGLRDEQALRGALLDKNRERCRPPLATAEVAAIAASAARTFEAPPPWMRRPFELGEWIAGLGLDHASDVAVLRCLCDMADIEGKAWPSISRLAERTRLAPRTVQGALRRLEAFGLDVRPRSWKTSVYSLSPLLGPSGATTAPPSRREGARGRS